MSYIVINRKPVYISEYTYRELSEEVLKDESPQYRVRSCIANSKESIEKGNRIFKFLKTKYKKDRTFFNNTYNCFDFKEKEIKSNIFDLLYDYGHYYKNMKFIDFRTLDEKLKSDLNGDCYDTPLGNTFVLECKVGKINILSILGIKQRKRVLVKIKVDNIIQISGTFENFIINYKDGYKIKFNKKNIVW